MTYVDSPNKKQKHPHYEHRLDKLNQKDNEFTCKKFQQIRRNSTHKKLFESLKRIGMRVNDKPTTSIPTENLDKVCFLLINDYKEKMGVGPLNDGYLVGLKHHKLGFKIFYLYNSRREEFTSYLSFFIQKTSVALTVFYSGRDDSREGIIFNDGSLSKSVVNDVISENSNGITPVIFISDCFGGGSVFDINGCSNMISFSTKKNESDDSIDIEKAHGIFTYYICKMINDNPSITPNLLCEKMNNSLNRFNESLKYQVSKNELGECPIYK